MNKFLASLLLLLLVFSVAGCETTKGVGRDVQKAGSWVENSAK